MKPGDEEALLAGLRALRNQSVDAGPSTGVEAALTAEFRRHKLRNEANSKFKRLMWVGLAAAAAAVVAVVAIGREPQPVRTQMLPKPVVKLEQRVAERAPEVQAEPRIRRVRNKARRPEPKPVPVREVATEFLAMPYAPRFTSEDRGQLVRVQLPRESMASFGLPVNQDRMVTAVKADVLIGEDGIARAIRFVQ